MSRHRRARARAAAREGRRHPAWTTLFFVASWAAVVASAVYGHPGDTAIGLGLMAAGLPAYLFWRGRRGQAR